MSSVTVEVGGSGGVGGLGGGGLVCGMGVEEVGVSWEEGGQYVVLLHINPGLTVNFTENGHVQRISGECASHLYTSCSPVCFEFLVNISPLSCLNSP